MKLFLAIFVFAPVLLYSFNDDALKKKFAEANFYYNIKKDYGNALKIWDNIINKYPSSKYAQISLLKKGKYYLREKKYLEAERIFYKLYSSYPDSDYADDGLYFYALTLYKEKNSKGAVRKLKELIRYFKNSSNIEQRDKIKSAHKLLRRILHHD